MEFRKDRIFSLLPFIFLVFRAVFVCPGFRFLGPIEITDTVHFQYGVDFILLMFALLKCDIL